MDKQYSIQFFTKFVEAMQKFCRDYLEFEQAVELSGYLSLEIDNYKKERYILSEMVHNTGDVISESYCVKAFKTMKRLPVRNNSDTVLRDNTNIRRSSGKEVTVDIRDSPEHQVSSYNSHHGYSPTSQPHNVLGRRAPAFAAGSASQVTDVQNRTLNVAMQIQPRQSQFSSSGMTTDDTVLVTVGDSKMGSGVRGQKRNNSQSEESPLHKKDKLDTDIESLYSAATSIVSTSESDITKNSYSAVTKSNISQNDTMPNFHESQCAEQKESSESIRLPIPETVTVKEENDVVFLDSPYEGSNNDFDCSQMESSFVMNESSHGSQGNSGGNPDDLETHSQTAGKNKAHVKVFQQNTSHPYTDIKSFHQSLSRKPLHVCNKPLNEKKRQVPHKFHQCDLCDYKSLYRTNLSRHRGSHFGISFQCPFCPKQSKDKYEHAYHLKGHAGQLSCPTCGKQYHSLPGLNHHKRTYKH